MVASASIRNLSEPLLAKVIGYTDIADPFERVSKAFHEAKRKAMQSAWKEGLLLSHPVAPATRLEITQLENEINAKARTHYPPTAEISRVWAEYVHFRDNSQTIYSTASGLPAPIADQVRGRRREHLREVSRMLDQLPVNFREIVRSIHEFNAQENLALRERICAIVPGVYENPEMIALCFKMLQENQRAKACETFQGRKDFEKIPRGLSFERNLAVERVIQKVGEEMDNNLYLAWQYIRFQLNPLPAGVPDAAASSSSIRIWLNDPANQPHLDRIWNLSIPGITAIPLEVAKLRYLTGLTAEGVRELPSFLAELRYLQWCTVQDNGLRLFSISDAFYRHMESMLYCWEGEAGCIYAPIDHMEEIPFRMWWKREYTIPHQIFTFSAFDCVEACLEAEFDRDTANCLLEIGIRLGAPIFIAIVAFDLLFNFTVFLLNLLIIDCIEPVITFARDRLGYNRMVKLT